MTALHHALETYRGHTIPHFRFVERRNTWFAFSGALIALSLIGLFASGLNYSIDFEGGARLIYPLETDVTVADVSATLADAGREGAEVQIVSGESSRGSAPNRSPRPATPMPCSPPSPTRQASTRTTSASRTWPDAFGADVRRQAIEGLLIVLASIGLLALRFEPKMALGAMIALVHDVVITAGSTRSSAGRSHRRP